MNMHRSVLTVTVLILAGGLTPVWAQRKVLVPGPPPLTQEMVDQYREIWEWYCNIKITPAQRKQYQQACIKYWNNRPVIIFNSYALSKYADVVKEWRGVQELKGVEREAMRVKIRDQWLQAARNDKFDDLSKFLVAVFDAAKKAGKIKDFVARKKDKVVVPVDPPLTQSMIGLHHTLLELILDLSFTDEQRRESERLMIADWKRLTEPKRQAWAKSLLGYQKVPKYNNYQRGLQRTFTHALLLKQYREPDALKHARFVLKVYEEAYKEGSARNPVLVETKPPLTQVLVDRYRDFLEVMLDLSISGGFTAAERKVLQDHLVKGWKKMAVKDRKELIADLEAWAQAAAPAKPADAQTGINTLRPKLLVRLSVTREDPLSRWLLALVARERNRYEALSAAERQIHQTRMTIAGNIAPNGSWRYSASRGGYEWVPGR